ncbi:MAG: prepilin-type N-terminal cleavage/methylation domain-containing protein [Candidatus Saccharimonas sp.]
MSNTYNYHHPSPISQTHHINKLGFTIVELLVVIVVIAILAAISIVAYNGVQQRARNSARVSEAQEWVKILNMYAATTGTYPFSSGSRCLGYDFPKYGSNTAGSCWDANKAVSAIAYQDDVMNADIEKVAGVKLPSYTRAVISESGYDRLGPMGTYTNSRLYIVYWLETSGDASTAPCPVGGKLWNQTNTYSCRISLPALTI